MTHFVPNSFFKKPFITRISNNCQFLLSPLTFPLIPTHSASSSVKCLTDISFNRSNRIYLYAYLHTCLHCRLMQGLYISIDWIFFFLCVFNVHPFFHCLSHSEYVCLFIHGGLFPLFLVPFFLLCIDSLSWAWVMRQLVTYI